MKLPPTGGVSGDSWSFRPGDGREALWILRDTRRRRELCRFGGGTLNHLAETGALCTRLRRHGRADRRGAEVETVSDYPFGGEARILRQYTLRDGFMEICVDVRPGRGEAVRDFLLDELSFPGEWSSIRIAADFPAPGSAPQDLAELDSSHTGTLWEGAEAPLVILLTAPDGSMLEIGSGDDLWRLPEQSGECTRNVRLERDAAGTLILHRAMLHWNDEAVVERRPWRFRYYLAWSDGRKREALGNFRRIDLAEVAVPPEGRTQNDASGALCWQSPAARKALRKFLRQEAAAENPGHLTLAVEAPALCTAAAHLERPRRGELPHWNLTEMAAFHDWAARLLAPRLFRMEFPADSIFGKLPSGFYLRNTPYGEVDLPEL